MEKNQTFLSINKKSISILLLGFLSGLPFLLVVSTLPVWLHELKISNSYIGYFVLVTLPYSCKFMIAPILENINFSFLSRYLGRYKSLLMVIQICLFISIICLGVITSREQILFTAFCAFCVSLFSACQDIVYEAYRIHISNAEDGYGAFFSMIGYRIGLLTSGAGSLYLSLYCNWCEVYIYMSFFMFLGIFVLLIDTAYEQKEQYFKEKVRGSATISFYIKPTMINSAIYSFFKIQNWKFIFCLIFFYKVSITSVNIMSMPFFLEIGFNKIEIASIVKTFGLCATIFGGILGKKILCHYHIIQGMLIWSILQILSNFLFTIQAFIGYNSLLLILVITCENLCCGIGEVILIAYFSLKCSSKYTMTHYALITSFSSFSRIIIALTISIVIDRINWIILYALIPIFSIPVTLLLFFYLKNNKYKI